MATFGAAPDDGGIQGLFEASPDRPVHTSVAAESAFLLGLVSLGTVPFSPWYAVSLGTAVLGVLCGVVGMATTGRPTVAGRVLAPLGLVLALTALALVGMRYLGVDTAFGDELLPTIRDWLERLNTLVPTP